MRPDERGMDLNTPSGLAELLRPWFGADDATVERSAVYRFHAAVAIEMRVGNVFLAGDSAHQIPPFLGQRLCSVLHDGVNLAWTLALVKEGRRTTRCSTATTPSDFRMRPESSTTPSTPAGSSTISPQGRRRQHRGGLRRRTTLPDPD